METVYIAGWRDGIRNPEHNSHWRLYRGLTVDLIPAREIRFVRDGVELPLLTASSKQVNAEGFHVWFDCQGDFTIFGETCYIDLGVDGARSFSFSVRPPSLYSSNDWRNWRVYDAQRGMNVRYVRFRYRGVNIPITSEARKISDPRELLAWIEVRGAIAIDGDHVTITLA